MRVLVSLAAAAWSVTIVIVSVVPTQEAVSQAAPGREVPVTLLGHFASYLVLAALLATALALHGAAGGAVLAALAAAGLGAGLELVQALLPYRDCQLIDVLVNVAGAAAGAAGFSVSRAGARRSRSRPG